MPYEDPGSASGLIRHDLPLNFGWEIWGLLRFGKLHEDVQGKLQCQRYKNIMICVRTRQKKINEVPAHGKIKLHLTACLSIDSSISEN